jgi:hypothetical protein
VLSSQQLDSHQNATVPHFRRDVDASGDRNSLTKQPVKGVSLDPPLRRQRLAPIGVTTAGGTQNSAVALEHANAEFVLVTPSSGGRPWKTRAADGRTRNGLSLDRWIIQLSNFSPNGLQQGKYSRVVFLQFGADEGVEVVHSQVRFRGLGEILFVVG